MPVVTLTALCLGAAVLATPVWRGGDLAQAVPDDEPPHGWHPPQLVRLLVGIGCLLLAITPWRIAQSQAHLNAARDAVKRGDCPSAVNRALDSLDAVRVRPEPRVVLAYCDVPLGRTRLALTQLDKAVQNDPGDWELRYIRAVVRARLGHDPRPALAYVHRLDPRETIVLDAIDGFRGTSTPAQWRRRALRTPLPGI
jgi:hypothetical protein